LLQPPHLCHPRRVQRVLELIDLGELANLNLSHFHIQPYSLIHILF
jgi:hypothetical protein